jgi:hypothetical protein
MQTVTLQDRFSALRAQTQRGLTDFLTSELQLGFTFVEIAITERDFGNDEHFQHSKKDAQEAARTIRHFLDRIADPGARLLLDRHCSELEKALNGL